MGWTYSKAGTLAVVVVIVSLLASGAAAGGGGHPGRGLFHKPYISTDAVKRNGERHELVEGTRIRLGFYRGRRNDWLGFDAGCNGFSSRVEIKPTRLVVQGFLQTLIGCTPARLRQERWIQRFVESNPRWRRDGRELRLRSDDDAIRFRRE